MTLGCTPAILLALHNTLVAPKEITDHVYPKTSRSIGVNDHLNFGLIEGKNYQDDFNVTDSEDLRTEVKPFFGHFCTDPFQSYSRLKLDLTNVIFFNFHAAASWNPMEIKIGIC